MMDYNQVYKQFRAGCVKNRKSPADWNRRAASMGAEPFLENHYNQQFLERVDLTDCETVLDVGCGPGNLLLPLCRQLEHGYGVDSASAMLDEVRRHAAEMKVANVSLFEQDWLNDLLHVPAADVVIASRCMDVDDMQVALSRLNTLARRRVYLTYRIGRSYLSDELLKVIGRDEPARPDHRLVMKILQQVVDDASCQLIETKDKRSVYADEQAFLSRIRWSVPDLTDEEAWRLCVYFRERMPLDKASGCREHVHPVRWALISWDKKCSSEPI